MHSLVHCMCIQMYAHVSACVVQYAVYMYAMCARREQLTMTIKTTVKCGCVGWPVGELTLCVMDRRVGVGQRWTHHVLSHTKQLAVTHYTAWGQIPYSEGSRGRERERG